MSAGALVLLVPLLALGALMWLAAYERRLLGTPTSGRGARTANRDARTPWGLPHDAAQGPAAGPHGRAARSGQRPPGRSRPAAPRHRR